MSNICIIIMMEKLVTTEHLVDYNFFLFFLFFFGGDRYLYYLDSGDIFIGVCTCTNSSNYTY